MSSTFEVTETALFSVSPDASIVDIVFANSAAPFMILILPMTGRCSWICPFSFMPRSVFVKSFHATTSASTTMTSSIHHFAKKFAIAIIMRVISGSSPPRPSKTCASVGMTFTMMMIRTTTATHTTKIGYVSAARTFSLFFALFS